jgi:hypothetical protein
MLHGIPRDTAVVNRHGVVSRGGRRDVYGVDDRFLGWQGRGSRIGTASGGPCTLKRLRRGSILNPA